MIDKNTMRRSKRRIIYQVSLTFILTAVFMSIYQIVKFNFFPDITLLYSNIVTVVFSALLASIAAYFIVSHHNELIKRRNDDIAERKQIHQENVFYNSLLETTIEATRDGILVVDNNRKVSITNKKFEELWKIPPSIIKSKDDQKLLDFILQQLKEPNKFLEKVSELYQASEKESYDIIEFKDGRVFERVSIPQKLDDNIIGRVWSFRDITDSKRAEQILEESEETYKAIFDNSSDGMFLLDNVFVDCNEAVCSLFNCEKSDIVGKTPSVFSPEFQPDGQSSLTASREKIEKAKNGEAQRFYWQHKRKDGSLFDAEVSLSLVTIRGNEVVFAIVRDITKRKQDENIREALYQISEAAFTASDMKSLYNKIHDAVSTLMPAINFYIAIHDDKTDMLSFPYMVDEFDPPYEPHKLGRGLTEYVLRTGEAILVDEELDLKLRDSGEVDMVGTPTLIWLGVPLKVEGKTIGVIVVQDYHNADTYGETEKQILVFVAEQIAQVVERKRNAEAIKKFSEELKELNTTKDKFFSIIAHDLKNPFITILGFSDILLSDYNELQDEERKYYITEMDKSAKLSHNLLQNLLQWSRAQTGRIDYNPKKIDLAEIINENFQLVNNTAGEKGIRLKHHLDKSLFVFADEDMLNTVLRNLLTNAIKFSNQKSEIEVKAEAFDEDYIEVSVADSGVGMNNEILKNLFTLDTTNSKPGTSGETGTGLGLILCKEFVEKHGGKIRVDSKPEEGSTFSFTLPKGKREL
ncbi:MAG: ATP-binding protein [Melioribacteraceae bacterium]|nr:ATP-binding protein [Melioribacteraceae bacterium]